MKVLSILSQLSSLSEETCFFRVEIESVDTINKRLSQYKIFYTVWSMVGISLTNCNLQSKTLPFSIIHHFNLNIIQFYVNRKINVGRFKKTVLTEKKYRHFLLLILTETSCRAETYS